MATKSKAKNRFMLFFIRNIIVLSIVAGVLLMVFFISMDTINLKSLIKEGMQVRSQIILMPHQVDIDEVGGKYFTREFIQSGDVALKETYAPYSVSHADYKLKIEKLWVWPWQISTTVRITETIDTISGADADGQAPPAWTNGEYKVKVRKVNSAWKIEGVELVDAVKPVATPTPNYTYLPAQPTPSPAPTPFERTGVITTGGDPVRIRSTADKSTNDNIIGNVPNGAKIAILGDEGDWLKIRYGEKIGYVSGALVKEQTE